MRAPAAILLAVALALPLPAYAEPPSQAKLERQLAAKKRVVKRLVKQRRELRREVRSLRSERDRALAGLPDAISAVPLDRFRELVFEPALATWRCDHVSEFGEGRWMIGFDAPIYCAL
jgi:hypothetical protein